MVNRRYPPFCLLACLLAAFGVRSSASDGLRDQAWSVLTKALRNGQPEDRDFATSLLGRTGDTRAGQALLDALASPHPSTRAAAANVFRTHHDLTSIDVLAAALRRESHFSVKMLLVESIATSGSPRAVEIVSSVLRDAN